MSKVIGLIFVAIIQLAALLLILLMPKTSVVIYPIIVVLSFVLILVILSNENRLSTSKFSWVILIAIAPLIGVILYLIFGNGTMTKYKKDILDNMHMVYSKEKKYEVSKDVLDSHKSSLIKYLDDISFQTSYLHYGGDITCYNYGREKFNDMIQDIRGAKSYIHIEYFIIKPGALFDEIYDELAKKASEGIEIRVVCDFLGSNSINRSIIRKFEQDGINFSFFNKLNFSFLTKLSNYRDHRKIVVIDGQIAYTGGFNIGDEYIDLNKRYNHWEDFHIRIANTPAVLEYETFFAQVWYFETRENLFKVKYYPTFNLDLVNKETLVYPYVDGPDSVETIVRDVFLKMIMNATKSIYISTPYLIPDEVLYDALLVQANSGVEITIVTPGLPDKVSVKMATESYYRGLIKAGVKIFEYDGFVHAKKMLVDDSLAIVGSANFDMRSFNLSFETCTLLINGQVIKDIKNNFIYEIQNSKNAQEKIENQSVFVKFIQLILRIFAPLL